MEFASQTVLYLALLVAYFIFALFKLRWAVLALPLFFPAYLLSFKIAGIPFNLIEGLIYVVFLALISHLILNKFFVQIAQEDVLRSKLWFPIALLLFSSIISVLIVPKEILLIDGKTLFESQKIALGIFKGWIVAPILALALFYAVLRTVKDLRLLLNFYVASSVFLAFWGIWQAFSGNYITVDMRASGPFISANYLALYIAPAVFYTFARLQDLVFRREKSPLRRSFLFFFNRLAHPVSYPEIFRSIFVFGILFLALMFTKSYSAVLALALAIVFYLLLRYKIFSKKLWLGVAIFLLLTALTVMLLDPVKWRQFSIVTERTSSSVRVEVYKIAIRLVLEHPFLGIGLGQFPAFYQLEAPRILGHAPYEWNMLHPHNLFLAFWLNLGIVGLIGLVWILVLCWRKAWSLIKIFYKQAVDSIAWYKVIAFFMLFIIIFHGLFDTPFFKNDLALLFWLIVSVILLPMQEKNA